MSMTTATVVSPGGGGRTQKMSTSQQGIPMMTHYVATSNRSCSVESARAAALDIETASPYSTRRNQRALAADRGGQRSREHILYDELIPVDGRRKSGGGKREAEEYSMKILR
jgi:nitrous oxide reductase accessory protein NosL